MRSAVAMKCSNPQFRSWLGGGAVSETARPLPGTFAWLIALYKASPKYLHLTSGTQADYDAVLFLVADHKLKDGRSFGELSLKSITPGAADKLHSKLFEGGRGNRQRTAKLAMDVCRRAWSVAYPRDPTIVPAQNPIVKMGLSYKPLKRSAATLEEPTSSLRQTNLAIARLGTAALIAFFWLQREEDIFLRLAGHTTAPATRPRHRAYPP